MRLLRVQIKIKSMSDLKGEVPDFQTIMLPMLDYLSDGASRTLNEVMKYLAKHFGLNDEHLKIRVPSGQMGLFRNRVGWTRSYLKKSWPYKVSRAWGLSNNRRW